MFWIRISKKFVRKRRKNAAAREDELDPGAVTNGLQGDAIQPLVIRGNQGECVRVIALRT